MSLVDPCWLLRVARGHAPDSGVRTAAVFARGSDAVAAVHRSQVTRWERGQTAPTYDVVRRYEILCGLEEGRLSAAVDLVHRHDTPVAAQPALRRPRPADPAARVDDLLARALSDEPLTGVDWDWLTASLGAMPDAFLRKQDWRDLVRRGLREMDVSVRLGYRQRAEAMDRIAGHPRAAGHVAELVGEILSDPGAQVYSEAAALLQYNPHPSVHDILRAVIVAPVSPHALRAALFAAATTVRDRRTPHDVAVELVRLSLELARDGSRPYRVRRSAADVLLALRPATRNAIARELSRRPEDLSVASIIGGGAPRPREQLRALRNRVVATLGDAMDTSPHDEPTLMRLLDYVSTETNDERRWRGLHLLMLLPFGAPVGYAYLEELRSSLARGDALGVHESLGVLLCLAPGDELGLLTDLAVRAVDVPDDADQVAIEACWAVGNADVVEPVSRESAKRIVDAAHEALRGQRPAAPELYEAWAYALGMHGHRDLLQQGAPAAGGDAAAWARARQWWLAVPTHLLDPEVRPSA